MSTKIFNGFTFTDSSLAGTVFLLGAQKNAIQELVDTKHRKALALLCAAHIDSWCIARASANADALKPFEGQLAHSAYEHCGDQLAQMQDDCRRTQRRNPSADCDVLLRLFGDPKTQRIVGFVCEENLGAYKHLLATPGVVDFSYWNNTDAPERIPEWEWSERAGVWDRAADSRRGFEFAMEFKPDFVFPPKLLVPHLPSLEQRASRRARDRALNEHVSENWTPRAPGDCTGMTAAVNAAAMALQDPSSELHARRERYEAQLRACLLEDLAPLLCTPLQDLPAM